MKMIQLPKRQQQQQNNKRIEGNKTLRREIFSKKYSMNKNVHKCL